LFANYSDTAGDFGSASVLADKDIAMARHALLELYEMQEALKRIGQRSHDVCVRCGNGTPVARLFAQPSALFCTPCLSTLERISGLKFTASI
jgi:DnaK suppressor protein